MLFSQFTRSFHIDFFKCAFNRLREMIETVATILVLSDFMIWKQKN